MSTLAFEVDKKLFSNSKRIGKFEEKLLNNLYELIVNNAHIYL